MIDYEVATAAVVRIRGAGGVEVTATERQLKETIHALYRERTDDEDFEGEATYEKSTVKKRRLLDVLKCTPSMDEILTPPGDPDYHFDAADLELEDGDLIDMDLVNRPRITKTDADRAEEYRQLIARYQEALVWCSGADYFGQGGKARQGWIKLCVPLLTSEMMALTDGVKTHTPEEPLRHPEDVVITGVDPASGPDNVTYVKWYTRGEDVPEIPDITIVESGYYRVTYPHSEEGRGGIEFLGTEVCDAIFGGTEEVDYTPAVDYAVDKTGREFCSHCGAGLGVHRRDGEGTCPECDPEGCEEHGSLVGAALSNKAPHGPPDGLGYKVGDTHASIRSNVDPEEIVQRDAGFDVVGSQHGTASGGPANTSNYPKAPDLLPDKEALLKKLASPTRMLLHRSDRGLEIIHFDEAEVGDEILTLPAPGEVLGPEFGNRWSRVRKAVKPGDKMSGIESEPVKRPALRIRVRCEMADKPAVGTVVPRMRIGLDIACRPPDQQVTDWHAVGGEYKVFPGEATFYEFDPESEFLLSSTYGGSFQEGAPVDSSRVTFDDLPGCLRQALGGD
jgi:hypothetical protein